MRQMPSQQIPHFLGVKKYTGPGCIGHQVNEHVVQSQKSNEYDNPWNMVDWAQGEQTDLEGSPSHTKLNNLCQQYNVPSVFST